MSSKKVAQKDTKASAKKPAAKTASKPAAKAPAKKTATASAAKKPAAKPAAKVAAKPAPKASKPAAKSTNKPASKSPVKAAPKPAPKAEKPAAKTAAKPVKKPVAAKPAAKPAPAKNAAKAAPKVVEKQPAKAAAKVAPKTEAKTSSDKNAVKPAVKEAPVSAPVEKASPAKVVPAEPKKESPAKVAAAKPVEAPIPAPVEETKSAPEKIKGKNGVEYDYAVLLQGVKRLSKTIMFTKVDEAEDRSNKKKMSNDVKNLDLKPTSPIRHKASLAEETQEELTERILKELEEQNRIFEREAATQMCTRCNRNLVSPEFWVDKHLGFCEECATILKLGQSKEARKVEYQLGAMDGDSLDEEDDDIIGPDADDLKAAEEDLADMED